MRHIRAEIDIVAPREWESAQRSARVEPPGDRAMTFYPAVEVAVPGRELWWLDHVPPPGLFDGEHAFRIEPDDGDRGCRFVREESFRGPLVPLLGGVLEPMERGFEAMNRAVKARRLLDPRRGCP